MQCVIDFVQLFQFLSTPSARRATPCPIFCLSLRFHFYPRPPRGGRRIPACILLFGSYFYPRPPRGGRPCRLVHLFRAAFISIHALREEGDGFRKKFYRTLPYFYPRPPRGGRPYYQMYKGYKEPISIHALREEGDCSA